MYTVYKIVNNLNGKFYIGVHKTLDPYDSYMGSGVAIQTAIKKYGKQNFTKEILLITEDKQTAYNVEKNLTLDFNDNMNYNMKLGGVGGWAPHASKLGGINCSSEDKRKAGLRAFELEAGIHKMTSEEKREAGRIGGLGNKGKPKTPEQKAKISAALKGKKKTKVV